MARDLRWLAQYANGAIVREHEFRGSWATGHWVEHPFFGLDLSRVISFGFEGSGLRVGFSTLDGILGINGRAIELRFVLLPSQRIFPLTGRKDTHYRTILQYKQGSATLGLGGIVHMNGRPVRVNLEPRQDIEAYVLGWEIGGFDDDLGGWEASLTCSIPTDEQKPILGLLRTVTERGMQGVFEWFVAGHRVNAVPTILPPGRVHLIALNFWRAE